MNSAVNELARSVVDKNSIHECSVNELEELTRQYPYFGPAQFLLAEKLKQENSPKYEQQSQKAILFFHDHLWFDYLSRKDDVTATVSSVTHHEPVAAPVINTPTEQKYVQPEEQPQSATIEIESIEQIKEEEEPEPPPPPSQIIIEEEPVVGEMHIESKQEEVVLQKEQENQEHQHEGEEDPETEIEPIPVGGEPPIRLPEFKIEPLDLNKPLTFEPFHTIDYFASQGIRARDEDKPKDKFSKQLRSFTEWLKTMKKLPESEVAAPPPAPEDQRVTQMAEHSIQDSQVVTETMAEVWEQQGNHEKAIETYRKLSLLNPAKSAYFATLIEQLKRQ